MHHGSLDAMKGFSDPEVGYGLEADVLPWWHDPNQRHASLAPLRLPASPLAAAINASPSPSPLCRPQSAKAFADKVNAAGGSAELFVYEGCGHGFLK